MTEKLRAGILIISETATKDPSTDKCEPALRQVFENPGGGNAAWEVSEVKVVPDDVIEIQRTVTQWTDYESAMNVIVTSGGTGFTGKDVTPEVSYRSLSPELQCTIPALSDT